MRCWVGARTKKSSDIEMNPVKCRVTTVTNTEDSVMLGTYDAIPNTSAVMDII